MTKQEYIHKFLQIFHQCNGNHVTIAEENHRELTLFEEPLIGFGVALDPHFDQYKNPEIIGPSYMTPNEWMDSSQTVISFFFPFTQEVKDSNTKRHKLPSIE